MSDPILNPINYLQEICQKRHGSVFPVYTQQSATGPAHCPTFSFSCLFEGHTSIGLGAEKKQAKKAAAAKMIQLVKEKGFCSSTINKTCNSKRPTNVKHPISALLEFATKEKIEPPVFFQTNPGSKSSFIFECSVKDKKTYGEGSNKRSAKALSAANMCEAFNIPFSMETDKSKTNYERESNVVANNNYVSQLQEYIKNNNLREPVYQERNLTDNMFQITCNVGPVSGQGQDLTKKEAKNTAAFEVLRKLMGSCLQNVENGDSSEDEEGCNLQELDFEEGNTPTTKSTGNIIPQLESLILDDSVVKI